MEKVKKRDGFTFLEVILSVVLITILIGISVPIYQSLQTKNDLDLATMTLAQSLRRAQFLSQAVSGDDNWGVYLETGKIIIFKGNSYLLPIHNPSFDEVFNLPPTISFSGLTEIVFNKFSGEPKNTGVINLISTRNGNKNLFINQKGMVEY